MTNNAEQQCPREVIVGPYRYGVEFDGQASYDHSFLGVCLNRSRRLKLDPRQSDTELPMTFLHEVLHALGSAYEIKEWARHTFNDKEECTDKIDLMASALLQFIRTNPDVVRWLQKTK